MTLNVADEAVTSVQRFELETSDVEQAHETLREAYTDHRVAFDVTPEDFRFYYRSAEVDNLAVGVLQNTMEVTGEIDPLHYVLMAFVVNGQLRFAAPREEVHCTPGDIYLYPQGVSIDGAFSRLDLRTLRLPTRDVAEVAAARLGVDPATLRFDSMRPVSASMRQYAHDSMLYLHRLFEGPEASIMEPLIRANAVELAAATVLAAFPNTAMSAEVGPSSQVTPAAIRRAMAFIEDRSSEPITAADIARAAGIGIRGLQASFHRHMDMTPLEYLRSVRLHRAHRDLRTADRSRGDTVAAIARRWGFHNLGRFSNEYRAAFGQPPSHTLRK